MGKSLPVADLSAVRIKYQLCTLSAHAYACRRKMRTLVSNEIADLFILGLFNGRFIVLRTLTEEFLLYEIDS